MWVLTAPNPATVAIQNAMCENCLVWEKNFLELIINLQLAVLS
jgi:hypothetical protein